MEDNLCWEIVRFFENHLGGKKREGTLCDDNRCGAGSRVVGVAPDGNLMPCGRFAWSDHHHYLGGLDESEESGATKFSERVYEFHSLNPENWLACARCEAASVCSFGCQAFIVRSQSRVNIECLPTKLRFAYYTENAEGLQPLYEKFCELQSRIPMSRLEQRLSKLHFLTPTEHRESVQRQLVDMMRRRNNIVATQDDKCEI